jgi:hypothetical protein
MAIISRSHCWRSERVMVALALVWAAAGSTRFTRVPPWGSISCTLMGQRSFLSQVADFTGPAERVTRAFIMETAKIEHRPRSCKPVAARPTAQHASRRSSWRPKARKANVRRSGRPRAARGRNPISCETDFPVGRLDGTTALRPAGKPVPQTLTQGRQACVAGAGADAGASAAAFSPPEEASRVVGGLDAGFSEPDLPLPAFPDPAFPDPPFAGRSFSAGPAPWSFCGPRTWAGAPAWRIPRRT